MKKNSLIRCSALAFGAAIVTVVTVASVASAAKPIRPCGPQYCLDVWNPVICSNGVVYSNACYAARACATGCGPLNY